MTANSIQDTTSWQGDRTLANLLAFLVKFSNGEESLKERGPRSGSPHTLIVTGAGLRAAEIARHGHPPYTAVAEDKNELTS